MTEQVFKSVHTKAVVIANNDAQDATNMEVGTLFVSGSKLHVRGATGAEVVTSA